MRPRVIQYLLYPDQSQSPDKNTVILGVSVCLILAFSPLFSKVASNGAAIISLWAMISFGKRYWSARTSVTFPSAAVRLLYIGFLLYFLSSISSLINNADLSAAGWRFDSYYPFFLTGVIVILFAFHKIQAGLSANIITVAVVFATSLMFVFSFYQLQLQGLHRAGVFTGYNPNIFAYIAGLYWLVVLALFVSSSDRKLLFPLLLVVAAGIYTILAAGSRGVIISALATALVIIVLALLKSLQQPGTQKKILIASLCTFIIGTVIFSQSDYLKQRYSATAAQVQEFTEGKVMHNAVSARLNLWQGGYKIWKGQPLFGTGIGDGQEDLDRLIEQGEVSLSTTSYAIFHNIYVDVLATTGLLGFLLMLLGIFILPGIYFWRTLFDSNDPTQIFAGLAGLGLVSYNLVFGLFNSWLFLRNLPVTLVLLLLLISVSDRFSSQQ